MIINLKDTKVFKCDNDAAKKIYDTLNVLPINIYYSKILEKDVNVFIFAKKLKTFIEANNIRGIDE